LPLTRSNRLAQQGANVVIVAYPDSAFEKNLQMLKSKYPSTVFREVPVDLSKSGEYMPKITNATNDIDVQIIFNNAGYIKTGFFCDVPLQGQLANHTCNATAALEVTHHFVSLLQKKKLRGCVGYTSSPAGFTPCPFSVVYGATKAYLTEFAASIAPELRPDGIDVCVVHPSPVASRFYEGTHALGALLFFKGTATGPETIANCLFASMGRTVIRDQGYYPTVAKLILKIFDFNLFTDLATSTAKFMPEFKTLKGVQAPPRAI
jgi:short-subunit dehydrogenase